MGEPVIAIGNPQGLGQSFSKGIVSAINRTFNDKKGNFIQIFSVWVYQNFYPVAQYKVVLAVYFKYMILVYILLKKINCYCVFLDFIYVSIHLRMSIHFY